MTDYKENETTQFAKYRNVNSAEQTFCTKAFVHPPYNKFADCVPLEF